MEVEEICEWKHGKYEDVLPRRADRRGRERACERERGERGREGRGAVVASDLFT